jgi:hypothetical protein
MLGEWRPGVLLLPSDRGSERVDLSRFVPQHRQVSTVNNLKSLWCTLNDMLGAFDSDWHVFDCDVPSWFLLWLWHGILSN